MPIVFKTEEERNPTKKKIGLKHLKNIILVCTEF